MIDRVSIDLGDLEGSIERAVYDGLDAVAGATAREAQTNHVYQNRTGDLQGSTASVPAEGDVWGDSASSRAVLGEQYASYVDRWAQGKTGAGILEYAWERVQGQATAEFERILIEALTRA
ncbi:MAG: hypothetical protein RIS45_463 [Planctomycetota bacterium]|jgi:hypothetical protein